MLNQKRIILFLCVFVILISFLSIFKTQETLVSNTNTVSNTIDSVIDDISGDFHQISKDINYDTSGMIYIFNS
tara:strand:+ start:137 stop:355 length:219 start_codon:yes stop_codon:yes gene_type:complete